MSHISTITDDALVEFIAQNSSNEQSAFAGVFMEAAERNERMHVMLFMDSRRPNECEYVSIHEFYERAGLGKQKQKAWNEMLRRKPENEMFVVLRDRQDDGTFLDRITAIRFQLTVPSN